MVICMKGSGWPVLDKFTTVLEEFADHHSPRCSSTHTLFRRPLRRHATAFLVFEAFAAGITDRMND